MLRRCFFILLTFLYLCVIQLHECVNVCVYVCDDYFTDHLLLTLFDAAVFLFLLSQLVKHRLISDCITVAPCLFAPGDCDEWGSSDHSLASQPGSADHSLSIYNI